MRIVVADLGSMRWQVVAAWRSKSCNRLHRKITFCCRCMSIFVTKNIAAH